VKDLLQSYYVRQGFLRAEVSSPRNELHPDTRSATVQVPIDEGTRSHLAEINFRGNKLFTDQELLAGIPLRVGQPYDPHLRNQSMSRIRNAYSRRGYNDVVIDYNVTAARETGRLNITFSIQENRKEVVRKIEVKGTERTDEHFVRELLKISTGEALDPQKLSDARRRMYDTGAYTQTQIETVELDKSLAQGPQEKPVGLEVTVREVKPYRLQYGGFYDTERGPGGIADITNRNSLANASVLGLRTRYDSDLREVRLYYSQPRVFGLPFDTNLVSFVNRELHQTAGFTVDRFGFSAEQQAKFRNQFIVSYGYRFEHDHTYEAGPNPFFDVTLNVAPLTATASRDLRDDVLDATRGSFTSHNLEYAPNFLGSDLRFIRYFGQYFQYIPLGPKREIPWAGGEPRARLVYAGGLRLGLARGFGGQNLVPSERFFAGGGTTIRGFVQDSIGPRNIIGDPAGGQAVFILNNELRFPLISIFDGVGFIDAGNVYRTVSDFNPFDLRSSAGFGLRVRTPYFLLRGDYGIKLDRKAGESFGEFYFSIGQAF
jgi:outer membrane protein assembly complex protein YaeT